MPFWYDGEVVARVLALAYRVGRVVEAETALVAVDVQTELDLRDVNLPSAVRVYTGTRRSVQQALAHPRE